MPPRVLCLIIVKKIDRQTFENDYKKSHKNLISVKGKRILYLEELSEK